MKKVHIILLALSTMLLVFAQNGIAQITVGGSLNLNLNGNPGNLGAPNVNLGPDRIKCGTQILKLDAGIGFSSYDWNTGENTRVIWAADPGMYICTVVNGLGQSSTDTVYVIQAPAPNPSFSYIPMIQTPGTSYSVQFTNSSQNAIASFWDFGDGYYSYDHSPNHNFPGPGLYTVCLEITNDCEYRTICQDVQVTNKVAPTVQNLDFGQGSGVKGMKVWPNPAADGEFQLYFEGFEPKSIQVVDLSTGTVKTLDENDLSFPEMAVPCATWKEGNYVIKANHAEGSITKTVHIIH